MGIDEDNPQHRDWLFAFCDAINDLPHDRASSALGALFDSHPEYLLSLFFLLHKGRLKLRERLRPGIVQRGLKELCQQLEDGGTGRFGWMHLWRDPDKLSAIGPFLDPHRPEVWDTALRSFDVRFLSGSDLQEVERFESIYRLVAEHRVSQAVGGRFDKWKRCHEALKRAMRPERRQRLWSIQALVGGVLVGIALSKYLQIPPWILAGGGGGLFVIGTIVESRFGRWIGGVRHGRV